MADTNNDETIIEEARDAFEECEEAETENRKNAVDDLNFGRMGRQWDESDERQRAQDGRPTLVVNRLPTFIRQIVNDARLNKPAIKVHPVDDNSDPEVAEILNGILRNIEVQSKADVAYDTAIDSAVSGGFGYFRIDIEYAHDDTFEQDIRINRIANPLTVYADPRSTAADSSDWNLAFVTEMMKAKEFEKAYPDAEPVDWETMNNDEQSRQWFQDNSVRLAEYWTRDEVVKTLLKLSSGEFLYEDDFAANAEFFAQAGVTVEADRKVPSHRVKQCLITGAEVLERTEWVGRYIPIIPVYGDEVCIEGKRYFQSLIHFAKDAQRIFNYWRSASTELVALAPRAPYIGKEGSFDEDPRWATANTQSHAYLEYSGDIPPQRQPFAGIPAGAIQEAMNASDDMKSVMGLYDASLGARSNETSGVAIKARQREGDISTFHFQDNMTRAIRHAGVVCLDLIPHVYSEPRVMRIMGEDEKPQSIPVNQPIPQMQDGQPQIDQEGNPVTKIYDLTVGKYDVTVKAGPSFTTRREEAANQMIEMVRAFPQAAPIMGDILADSLDWPRADEIAKRLQTLLPQHLQGGEDGPDPQVLAMQQQMQEGLKAYQAMGQELEALKADKSIDAQKVQIDAMKAQAEQVKVQIEQYRAETERYAAEAEAAKDQAEAKQREMETLAAMNTPQEPAPAHPPNPPLEPVQVHVHGEPMKARQVEVVRDEFGNMVGAEMTETEVH